MTYSHSVVGIFDRDFDAQDAVDELIKDGFDRKDIEVNNMRNVNNPSTYDREEKGAEKFDKHESSITAFFKTIFGDKEEEADKHSRLVVEGGAVITVYVESEEQATRAADVLDANGAIDVDERSSMRGVKTSVNNASPSTGVVYDRPNGGRTNTDTEITNLDRQTDEDLNPRQRREESSGPGVGSTATGGNRSKSRIVEWRGEASARLRNDRDSETKIGW